MLNTGKYYNPLGHRDDKPGAIKERISLFEIASIPRGIMRISASIMTGRVVLATDDSQYQKIYRNLEHAMPVIKKEIEYYGYLDHKKCDAETGAAQLREEYERRIVPYLKRELISLFYLGDIVSLCTRTLTIHYGDYWVESFSDFDAIENKLNEIINKELIDKNRFGFGGDVYVYDGYDVVLGPNTIHELREIYEKKIKPYRDLNNAAKSAAKRK
jgi:hypothetical protein